MSQSSTDVVLLFKVIFGCKIEAASAACQRSRILHVLQPLPCLASIGLEHFLIDFVCFQQTIGEGSLKELRDERLRVASIYGRKKCSILRYL